MLLVMLSSELFICYIVLTKKPATFSGSGSWSFSIVCLRSHRLTIPATFKGGKAEIVSVIIAADVAGCGGYVF